MNQLLGKQLADDTIVAAKIDNDAIEGRHISTDASDDIYSREFNCYPILEESGTPAGTGTTVDVTDVVFSASISKRTAGGASQEGVVTTTTHNRSALRNNTTMAQIEDTLNRRVFGRVTDTITPLTGTLTFTNGSAVVTAVGGAFTTELANDDYIRLDSSGVVGKILSITDDDNLTLTANYAGASGTGAGSQVELILNFFVLIASVETAHNMNNETIDFIFNESLTIVNRPFTAFAAGFDFSSTIAASSLTENVEDLAPGGTVSTGQVLGNIAKTPLDVNKVFIIVNGSTYGKIGGDVSVSGTTVTWNGNFNIEPTDTVIAHYFSA